MTWDTDRAYVRVDEFDVPSTLADFLSEHAADIATVTLQVECHGKPGGRSSWPTAGTYTPENTETASEVARAVAGMALAAVEAYGSKAAGRFRVRVKGLDGKRTARDVAVRDIGTSFEDSDARPSHPSGDGGPECIGCRVFGEVVTTLQMENGHLREMVDRVTSRGEDRVDRLLAQSEERFDAVLNRTESMVTAERDRRDAAVDKQSEMAMKVLDPTNDATGRALGILDKGVALVDAALEQHKAISQATGDDRQAKERADLARQLITSLTQVAGPLLAAKFGIPISQVQNTMPTDTAEPTVFDAETVYAGLVQARNELFTIATNRDWDTARKHIGEEAVSSILRLREQNPLQVADARKACATVLEAGTTRLAALAGALPAKVTEQILLIAEISKEAKQP